MVTSMTLETNHPRRRRALRPKRKPWIAMALITAYLLSLAGYIGYRWGVEKKVQRCVQDEQVQALNECWEVVDETGE